MILIHLVENPPTKSLIHFYPQNVPVVAPIEPSLCCFEPPVTNGSPCLPFAGYSPTGEFIFNIFTCHRITSSYKSPYSLGSKWVSEILTRLHSPGYQRLKLQPFPRVQLADVSVSWMCLLRFPIHFYTLPPFYLPIYITFGFHHNPSAGTPSRLPSPLLFQNV